MPSRSVPSSSELENLKSKTMFDVNRKNPQPHAEKCPDRIPLKGELGRACASFARHLETSQCEVYTGSCGAEQEGRRHNEAGVKSLRSHEVVQA